LPQQQSAISRRVISSRRRSAHATRSLLTLCVCSFRFARSRLAMIGVMSFVSAHYIPGSVPLLPDSV
jgi:hypothetical protein